MAAVSLTRQCRHDRSIARRPPATVGTLRQHGFELAELTVRGIDYDGDRMVTVTVGDPHTELSRIVLRQFHVALGLRHKSRDSEAGRLQALGLRAGSIAAESCGNISH